MSSPNLAIPSPATRVEALAEFAAGASFASLSSKAVTALKIRILDSLGVAVGALDAAPPAIVRRQIEDLGGGDRCSLIGGGRSSPDRAALYNGALVRYLDFNDSYLAPGETCHPSDSLAAVLAAAEYAGADGRALLVALAVAYQVQCRLSDLAPVRARGFDHTTHGAYAAAAGVARALGLDAGRSADAIAIAGTAQNALRVTRTGKLSQWKGLAAPWAAEAAPAAAFLAKHCLTGPREVFEGNEGFFETISGPFELDWAGEGLGAVRATALKRHDAEIHSQSALEALLELRARHHLDPRDLERVELDTFQVAYDIIGGGGSAPSATTTASTPTRWTGRRRGPSSTGSSSPLPAPGAPRRSPRCRPAQGAGRRRPHRSPQLRPRGVTMTTTTQKASGERAFAFLPTNRRPAKPRSRGVTEIRGPYYSAMGRRYLEDVLETMGEHVDSLKFAGGSFTLMPERALREIIDVAHDHDVLVSTGGFIEHVLTRGAGAADRYIEECARLGFDVLEISAGFISIATDDILRLVERVQRAGLKAKPEVGIQFGAGGATTPAELEQEGTRDVGSAIEVARRTLEAGAYMIMIESEGITEEVRSWRTDVVSEIVSALGIERVMFEAADPEVFGWYVKNYGPEVNLFVDHSQIVQLECLRRGIWGTKSLWGRVLTYPDSGGGPAGDDGTRAVPA